MGGARQDCHVDGLLKILVDILQYNRAVQQDSTHRGSGAKQLGFSAGAPPQNVCGSVLLLLCPSVVACCWRKEVVGMPGALHKRTHACPEQGKARHGSAEGSPGWRAHRPKAKARPHSTEQYMARQYRAVQD